MSIHPATRALYEILFRPDRSMDESALHEQAFILAAAAPVLVSLPPAEKYVVVTTDDTYSGELTSIFEYTENVVSWDPDERIVFKGSVDLVAARPSRNQYIGVRIDTECAENWWSAYVLPCNWRELI